MKNYLQFCVNLISLWPYHSFSKSLTTICFALSKYVSEFKLENYLLRILLSVRYDPLIVEYITEFAKNLLYIVLPKWTT